MFRNWKGLTMAGILVALVGCSHDRPHEYGQQRPPVDEVDPRDKGLQSADVVAATDRMASRLLAMPSLNASQTQWQIVVDRVDNQTSDRDGALQDYRTFLARLRTKLFEQGQGRLVLVENLAQFRDLRNRELETGGRDPFSQGGGGQPVAPNARQPDFSLYARITDLPNRGTNYYYIEFTLTNLHDRTIAWTGAYEVRVAR
jgi:hypothetical protein